LPPTWTKQKGLNWTCFFAFSVAGEFKSVIGCEAEVVQLKCNRSSRLAIYSANFGRTEYESPVCPQSNGVPEECKYFFLLNLFLPKSQVGLV
jgi:hypothetical protein